MLPAASQQEAMPYVGVACRVAFCFPAGSNAIRAARRCLPGHLLPGWKQCHTGRAEPPRGAAVRPSAKSLAPKSEKLHGGLGGRIRMPVARYDDIAEWYDSL